MAIVDFTKFARSAGTSRIDSGKLSNTAFDLLDPSNARRAISGLLPGGFGGDAKNIPNIGFNSNPSQPTAQAAGEDDWRVRLSLAENAQILYKDPSANYTSIMAPLLETNGVIWPYTPSIQVSHTANYTSQSLTHSNYAQQFYTNSDVSEISISGEFTVQSQDEGQYLMAVIYFLRASTKMFFGQGSNVGNPPPILFLDGYGSHYFPHVPCVVTSFQHTLKDDVDYIQVPINQIELTEEPYTDAELNSTQQVADDVPAILRGGRPKNGKMSYQTITTTTRLPTSSTIAVNVRPVYSRKNIHERFNLEDFAKGKLIADKKRGLGGFI